MGGWGVGECVWCVVGMIGHIYSEEHDDEEGEEEERIGVVPVGRVPRLIPAVVGGVHHHGVVLRGAQHIPS